MANQDAFAINTRQDWSRVDRVVSRLLGRIGAFAMLLLLPTLAVAQPSIGSNAFFCDIPSPPADLTMPLHPAFGLNHDFEASAHAQPGDYYPDSFVLEVTDLDIAQHKIAHASSRVGNLSQATCNSFEIVATLYEAEGTCYEVVDAQPLATTSYFPGYPGNDSLGIPPVPPLCTITVSWSVSDLAQKVKVVAQAYLLGRTGKPYIGKPTNIQIVGD